jgi:hypothetical protein
MTLSTALPSFHLLNQHARMAKQVPQFLKRFACISPMFDRIFGAAWSARSGRSTGKVVLR